MPIRPLSQELAEIAKTVLNEDPEQTEDKLLYFKDWISKQPHLKARTGKFFFWAYKIYLSKKAIDLFKCLSFMFILIDR